MRVVAAREGRIEGIGVVEAQPGDAAVAGLQLHQHLRQLGVARRTSHQADVRRLLENLFAFLLRHAADHREDLPFAGLAFELLEPVENFLLRLIADGAGCCRKCNARLPAYPLVNSLDAARSRSPSRNRAHSSGSRMFRCKKFCPLNYFQFTLRKGKPVGRPGSVAQTLMSAAPRLISALSRGLRISGPKTHLYRYPRISTSPPASLSRRKVALRHVSSSRKPPACQISSSRQDEFRRGLVWMDRCLDLTRTGPMYLAQESVARVVATALGRGVLLGHYDLQENPVKAGLVQRAEDYAWSSAFQRPAGAETSLGAADTSVRVTYGDL